MTASHANTPFKSPISLVPRARVACRRRRPGRVAAPGGFPAPAERSDIRAHCRLGKVEPARGSGTQRSFFPLSLAPSPGAPGCGRPVSLLQPCESITYFIQFPTLRSMALGVKVVVEGKRTYPARPTRQQL